MRRWKGKQIHRHAGHIVQDYAKQCVLVCSCCFILVSIDWLCYCSIVRIVFKWLQCHSGSNFDWRHRIWIEQINKWYTTFLKEHLSTETRGFSLFCKLRAWTFQFAFLRIGLVWISVEEKCGPCGQSNCTCKVREKKVGEDDLKNRFCQSQQITTSTRTFLSCFSSSI